MKNTERLYFLLVAAILVMLLSAGVLAYIFFDVLVSWDTSLDEELGADVSGIVYDDTIVSPDRRRLEAERIAPTPHRAVYGGPSGRERKYELKVPSATPPEGTPLRIEEPEPEARRRVLDNFAELPIFFRENCSNYGGLFDFHAAGAGFEILLSPGRICLHMRRADVHVPEGTNLIYRLADGAEVEGCSLESEARVCMEMRGIQPAISQWTVPPDSRTNTVFVCENFRRWHRSLPGAGAGAGSGSTDSGGGPGGPAAETDISRNRTHYFTTADPKLNMPDLVGHASVEYPDVYPGIDLACYGDQNRLEYVFTIWPGANPSDINYGFNGVDNLSICDLGHLVLDFEGGRIVQHAPRIYQVIDDVPIHIEGGYVIEGSDVRFRIDEYDRNLPLVISPELDYLSFLGGPGFERAYGVAVDNNGYAYVAGESSSPLFGAAGAGPDRQRSNVDIFVTKFRILDSRPIYTAFIGGGSTDRAFGIAADSSGNAYLCGETLSVDFPVTNSPPYAPTNEAWNGFVTKLSPDGQSLVYSSVFGGSNDDRFYGIAIDSSTNIYLAGETSSIDLPAIRGFQRRHRGSEWDAFVVRINGRTMRPDYSTYFGGGGNDSAHSIAVDARRNVYIAGETSSADLQVVNALNPIYGGGAWDAFIARIRTGGARTDFVTYLGGGNDDRINGISVDSAANIYVSGETASGDFPVTTNAVQRFYGGGDWDAFVTKLAPGATRLVYSSFLGGRGDDRGFDVDCDTSGNAYFVGGTASTGLPTVEPIQSKHGGGTWDAFVSKFNAGGSALVFSSFIGGERGDEFYTIAVDGSRSAHFAGVTSSTNLPVVNALQSSFGGGGNDAFAGRLLPEYRPGPEMRLVSAGGQPGGPDYDFSMSRYEISNREFVRFLNDAQANTNNARGSFCWFDGEGNVWFNPAMETEHHEMFTVSGSRIVYEPEYEIGDRYAVTPLLPQNSESYTNHPVVNVSWYGAVKYCNWLTIDTGRGAGELCYLEGTNSWQWMPVTASSTNWMYGVFMEDERRAWLERKGYRLPMDNCDKPTYMTSTDLTVSNLEFVRFLNDAEANDDNARGANMYFDTVGDVWFNSEMERQRHEMFKIAESRVVYDVTKPVGERYSVTDMTTQYGIRYDDFPVGGVTCFGGAKYCNWLTLDRGLPEGQRCYTEGDDDFDWAPVTCDPGDWSEGVFTEDEQEDWLELDGVRMPLQLASMTGDWAFAELRSYTPTNSSANVFNEFYKAGAWSGMTNMAYGFGRRILTPSDANYLDSGGTDIHGTTPVGFYSGDYYTNLAFRTTTNENLYGIYDISGNVSEWINDPGKRTSLMDRACYGGSWMFAMPSLSDRFYVHPHFTDRFRGFRVVSTATDQDMYIIRIPYRICLAGRGVGPGCEEDEEVAEEEEAVEDNVLRADESSVDIDGVIYDEEVPEEEVPEGEEEPEVPDEVDIPEASPGGGL